MRCVTQLLIMNRVVLTSVLGLLVCGCHTPLARVPSPTGGPPQLAGPARILTPNQPDFVPPSDLPDLPLPSVMAVPEKNQQRTMTLDAAIATAMENSDVIRTLGGDNVVSTDITQIDPDITNASRLAAMAAFDASLQINYLANRYNDPPSTFFGPGIPANTRLDESTVTAALVKPWASGATTTIGYNPSPGYAYFPNGTSGLFNPIYSSNFELSITQPLLQGAGTNVNRAPIRVARLRADQSIWDVKAASMALVRSVTEAYWSLQASHEALRAIDDVMPSIDEVVQIQQGRFEEERTIRAEVAKAVAQQATFRQLWIAARAEAMKQELHLRNLMGLPPNDGFVIVPTDKPSHAPFNIDPAATMKLAADNRPDIMRQRLAIRIREQQLIVAENGVKPQLNVQALYRTNGLSDDLGSSVDMAVSNQYIDWTAGASFSVPIGRRAGRANREAAELLLSREQMILRQRLHAASHELGDIIRQLEAVRNELDQAEIRMKETEEWLKGSRGRYEDPPPGAEGQDWLLAALNDYLFSLRSRSDSITDVARLVASYNTLLVRLEEAEGVLLANYGIALEHDPINEPSLLR